MKRLDRRNQFKLLEKRTLTKMTSQDKKCRRLSRRGGNQVRDQKYREVFLGKSLQPCNETNMGR